MKRFVIGMISTVSSTVIKTIYVFADGETTDCVIQAATPAAPKATAKGQEKSD